MKGCDGDIRCIGGCPKYDTASQVKWGCWQKKKAEGLSEEVGEKVVRGRGLQGWVAECCRGPLTFVCNLASCFSSRLVCL